MVPRPRDDDPVTPIRRRARTLLVTVLLGALAAGVTGCTIFPTVPDGADDALDALLADLRAEPGVASAEGGLSEGYGTRTWTATVRVRATSDDIGVAERVREHTDTAIPGSALSVSLALPPGTGTAPATVDPTVPRVVAAVDHLRREPDVDDVSGGRLDARVRLTALPAWRTVVPRVRSLTDGVPVTLASVDSGTDDTGDTTGFEVAVDRTWPGPALLGALDTLQPQRVRGTLATIGASGEVESPPEVAVRVQDVDAAVHRFTETEDEAAAADPHTRTAFRVSGPTGTVDGWLGLPLSASDPRTTPLPWSPRDVSADDAAVRAFLESSAESTGIPAEVTSDVERCSSAGDVRAERWTGTRATGSVLVPVFQRFDDAQESYDRVTAAWAAAGLRSSGQAMGLESFSAGPGSSAGVEGSTIRGTAGGLWLTATAPCRD